MRPFGKNPDEAKRPANLIVVDHLGIEDDDALEMAEQTEV